ncbi:MAG TPA: glycosyl hydrolase family 79 C-terminal domain-containing protein [Verrucomicrobiae bacterium]|nr:glycosyl hydrolase family 79 C-terminal domain-containing protein [Verrucomicrobiae bacterium]
MSVKILSTLGALLLTGVQLLAQDHPVQVKIQVDPQAVVGRISPDFIGLGYETSAVAQSNYFSAANTTLVRLYRNLSPHGLIRIGGNISDHTRYEPDGVATVQTETNVTVINRHNLEELAGFVHATGWRVMWGLNLGTGSREAAVREAQAVSEILGDHLQSFEIGNEVDIRGRYTLRYHDFDGYYSNYLAYKASIRAALPSANFSGPDSANNLPFVLRFATNEAKDIRLLTHHYYRTGAKTSGATIENLLKLDEDWCNRLLQLQAVSRESGVPFRINEVNSFYGGGKAGVSDTFASALWVLDYMYQIASYGGDGVNMETDINQLGWISHYSPIVHDQEGHCHARPEYYGMLAFGLTGAGDLLKTTLDKGGAINLTAYATRNDSSLWVTLVNKDLSRDAEVAVALAMGYTKAEAFRLEAPAITSTNQVVLSGAEVSANGQWTAQLPQSIAVKAGIARVTVPHASAVLLKMQR